MRAGEVEQDMSWCVYFSSLSQRTLLYSTVKISFVLLIFVHYCFIIIYYFIVCISQSLFSSLVIVPDITESYTRNIVS